jgi:hypothetical protein
VAGQTGEGGEMSLAKRHQAFLAVVGSVLALSAYFSKEQVLRTWELKTAQIKEAQEKVSTSGTSIALYERLKDIAADLKEVLRNQGHPRDKERVQVAKIVAYKTIEGAMKPRPIEDPENLRDHLNIELRRSLERLEAVAFLNDTLDNPRDFAQILNPMRKEVRKAVDDSADLYTKINAADDPNEYDDELRRLQSLSTSIDDRRETRWPLPTF